METDAIKNLFQEHDVQQVKLGGFDIDGILRGKLISLDKFWSSLEKGFGFCDVIFGWDMADDLYDNVKVTGWDSGYPDVKTRIDPTTLRFYRYEPNTAHVLCDFYTEDGKPHPACPRNLLKRTIAKANSAGLRPKFSAEFEFWVFDETPHSLREKGFQNLQPISPGMFGYSWVRTGQHREFVHDLLSTLRDYDIEIEGIHTETGPGVYEAAIGYDDALRSADKAALFKTTVKDIAYRHGLMATFMAKWNADLPGSSGHIHQSLWDSTDSKNVFSDPKSEHGLSEALRHYVGGQVKLMPEFTAFYSPTINTYKRYVPGVWAPLSASWGVENRTCAVRVIPGYSSSATRVEYRQTASDINPYIAMAACLGAGLHGMENAIEPPAPIQGDATATGAPGDSLPRTLREATDRLKESTAARQILGEDFVDHYVRTREFECRRYDLAVTNWEMQRYFETV